MIKGSCLCGRVKYKVLGEPQAMYYCHCSMCRKATGSSFATNMLVREKDFVITAGSSVLKAFHSSPGEDRVFCSACGSPIYSKAQARAGVVSVRCGGLDDDPGVRPTEHIYVGSKAPWFEPHDGLAQYLEGPVTAMQLRIRIALPADSELLAELATRTFRDTFARDNSAQDMEAYVRDSLSPAQVQAELADRANTFLLAFTEGAERPIGYAKLRTGTTDPSVIGPNPVELQRLYVDQHSIGLRVGAALMQASLEAARSAGHRTLWLGVWEKNARAISFYQKWEFVTVGDHGFRLGSDDQTDLIMERPVPGVV